MFSGFRSVCVSLFLCRTETNSHHGEHSQHRQESRQPFLLLHHLYNGIHSEVTTRTQQLFIYSVCLPNGDMFPPKIKYLVHYIENRVPFGKHTTFKLRHVTLLLSSVGGAYYHRDTMKWLFQYVLMCNSMVTTHIVRLGWSGRPWSWCVLSGTAGSCSPSGSHRYWAPAAQTIYTRGHGGRTSPASSHTHWDGKEEEKVGKDRDKRGT